MSFRAMVLKRSLLAVFFSSLGAFSSAFGQAANAPVEFANQDAITTSFVTAPNLAGTSGAASSNGNTQWLKVEVHFGTTAALKTPFLDSVDVKVWIEARDMSVKNSQGTLGVAAMLTGTVTYINIAPSKDVYGVFYVHPSTLAKYSDGGTDNFDRKYNIHAKLLVGGAVVDSYNKIKVPNEVFLTWYTTFPVIPGLVLRQDQTPFIIADPDRYPAVKLPSAAQ